MVCSFGFTIKHKAQRYALIFIWAALYLAYTALFAKRMQSWNWNSPGHCYSSNPQGSGFLSSPGNWAAIFSSHVFISLLLATGVGIDLLHLGRIARNVSIMVLSFAAVQSPIHTYCIFALRGYNEAFLTSGTTEQQWGFGQTVAIILLGTNIVVLVNGIQGTSSCQITS